MYYCSQVMQGFGVGYISKRISDGVLLKMSTAALAVSYLLLVCNCVHTMHLCSLTTKGTLEMSFIY